MIIRPASGMALIREDRKDYADASISVPDQAKRGVGTTGIIVSVTNLPDDHATLYWESLQSRCPWIRELPSEKKLDLSQFCSLMERGRDRVDHYEPGQHVVFSKFNEQIVVMDGGVEHIYFSVPVQAILGVILE